jgi:hypothetical protein
VAAKHLLRSVPNSNLQTGRERASVSPGVDDADTTGDVGRLDLCETVVDREW